MTPELYDQLWKRYGMIPWADTYQWAGSLNYLREYLPEIKHVCDRHGIMYWFPKPEYSFMVLAAMKGNKYGVFDEFFWELSKRWRLHVINKDSIDLVYVR